MASGGGGRGAHTGGRRLPPSLRRMEGELLPVCLLSSIIRTAARDAEQLSQDKAAKRRKGRAENDNACMRGGGEGGGDNGEERGAIFSLDSSAEVVDDAMDGGMAVEEDISTTDTSYTSGEGSEEEEEDDEEEDVQGLEEPETGRTDDYRITGVYPNPHQTLADALSRAVESERAEAEAFAHARRDASFPLCLSVDRALAKASSTVPFAGSDHTRRTFHSHGGAHPHPHPTHRTTSSCNNIRSNSSDGNSITFLPDFGVTPGPTGRVQSAPASIKPASCPPRDAAGWSTTTTQSSSSSGALAQGGSNFPGVVAPSSTVHSHGHGAAYPTWTRGGSKVPPVAASRHGEGGDAWDHLAKRWSADGVGAGLVRFLKSAAGTSETLLLGWAGMLPAEEQAVLTTLLSPG
ncbi:unnamed protein product [Laminaria digitata]